MATRRPIRGHPTLAPTHLGEAASAAAVVIVVGGIAGVILGAAMLVSGLTMGSRYVDAPPPHLATLGTGPILGGLGILVLGIAMLLSGLATIADVRGTRRLSALLSLIAAALAATGVVLAMLTPPPDVIIAIALAVATLAFGVSGIVLLRPRRSD